MNQIAKGSVTGVLAACILVPATVSATNGYAPYGWGTKSKAMAGVATALPQDTLVTATNPAGMAFIGTSLDLGVSFFNPTPRGYEANDDYGTQMVPAVDANTGAQFNASVPTGAYITPGKYDSDRDWFLIPSFGYNRDLDERSTIGIAIYGAGGMNTTYRDTPVWEHFAPAPNQQVVGGQPVFATNPPVPFDQGGRLVIDNGAPIPVTTPIPGGVNGNPNGYLTATTPTGVNLEQLFVEIPYTYKFGDGKQSVGIAPVFAVQSFEAKGLEPFRAASVSPDNVTNNGKDWSYGVGLHLGWYGQVNDQLALGLSYRTETWMTKLSDYKGLFADGGDFNIPAMLNFGVAYKAKPNFTVAFDYQHIFYGEINSLANSNDKDLSPCFTESPKPAYCLGGKDGLGFGWDSMDVFKLGVKYDHNEKLSFMAGASYNSEFSSGRQALFNILAPATIRWHLTLGASYQYSKSDAFNISLAYMPKETVDGTSPSITQAQTGSIYMEQKEIEISWSHHF
jgi:long-chain fatty acid transport protein